MAAILLLTFPNVEEVDANEINFVRNYRLHSALLHRLPPFDAVRFDRKAVQVIGDDVTGFMDDRFPTLFR